MSYLRALVLLVISAVAVVAVPAVTSATTDDTVPAKPAQVTTAASAGTPPTTTPPPTTATPTPTRLTVESGRSITSYRERDVLVSATGLDVADTPDEENATLRLDGDVLQELYVVDGAFEVRTTLPVETSGTHVLSVTAGGRELASTTFDVLPDPYTVTATPSWITAAKLRTDGVTLSAREVPPNGIVTASIGDNSPVTKRAVDDGTISITVKNSADSTLDEPGVYRAVLETEDGERSSVEVRVTVLDVAARGTSGTVRATGFEPRTDVALTSSRGSQTATADAEGVATFALPKFAGEVTATGTAGTVTTLVDTRPTGGIPASQMQKIADQAAAVEAVRASANILAGSIAARDDMPGALPPAAQQAIDAQLAAYKRILDALPQQPPVTVGKTTGSDTRDKLAAIGEQQKKIAEETKKSEKRLADAVEQAAADASDAYTRANEEQQRALEEMMRTIMDFVQDLNDARAEQMRAITRASTLELLSVGALDDLVEVPVPVGFTGRHHVGSIEPSSGLLLAWQPFDVAADASGAAGAGGALPGAGAPVTPALLTLGAALVVAGATAVVTARRRRPL